MKGLVLCERCSELVPDSACPLTIGHLQARECEACAGYSPVPRTFKAKEVAIALLRETRKGRVGTVKHD